MLRFGAEAVSMQVHHALCSLRACGIFFMCCMNYMSLPGAGQVTESRFPNGRRAMTSGVRVTTPLGRAPNGRTGGLQPW